MKPSGHASKKGKRKKRTGGCPGRLDRVLSLSVSLSVSLLALFKFHAWMFRGMAIKGVEGMNTGVTIGGGGKKKKKKLFAASLGGKRKQEASLPLPPTCERKLTNWVAYYHIQSPSFFRVIQKRCMILDESIGRHPFSFQITRF